MHRHRPFGKNQPAAPRSHRGRNATARGLRALLLAGLALLAGAPAGSIRAEDTTARRAAAPAGPELLIGPSSTLTKLARADLTVTPLGRQGDTLAGSYRIKVTPFAFKNDHGSLSLDFPEATFAKFASGKPVAFTGVATSAKDGKTKAVTGKTVPDSAAKGAVSFIVTTPDGDLLFESTYEFARLR